MPSRRRSRIKSISGNINDVQKRLRYLETRPAPAQLARKVVATQNIALRAIEPDVVADAAIIRRTLAPEAVISANLSVVGDPDGAAVATDNIQLEAVDTAQVADLAVTNDKLAGDIEDGKIVSISASKVGPDLLQDDQLDGLSTDKLIGTINDAQIDSVDAATITVGQIEADQIASIDAATITVGSIDSTQIDSVDAATITVGLIQDEQIDGISGEKIIGGIDGDLIVALSITGGKLANGTVTDLQLGTASVGRDELKEYNIYSDNIVGTTIIGRAGTHPYGGIPHLQNFTIGSDDIFSGAITTNKIETGAVTGAKIADSAVTTAKIAGSAVTTAKISDSAVTFAKTSGFGSLLTTATVTGTGISRNFGTSGNFRSLDITLSTGTGATQVAIGNHTHATTGVASHTHPVSASISGAVTGAGSHGGHSGGNTGGHSHNVTINSSITTSAPSSLKLKKEISDHRPVDIKNILNLKLKKYKYKNQLRHMHEGVNREWMHGYIAEEVQELGFEELLGYDEKGEPASLNYGLLSTLILELVKVQQSEIDSLKEEIQRLKEKI